MDCSQATSSRSHLLIGGLACPEKKPLEPALGHGAESWPAQLSGLLTSREPLATPLRAIWGSGENEGQQQRVSGHQEVPPEHKIRRPPETIISTLSAMSPVCPSGAAPQPAGAPPIPTLRCPGAQPAGLPSLTRTGALCSETWSQQQGSSQGLAHMCMCPPASSGCFIVHPNPLGGNSRNPV